MGAVFPTQARRVAAAAAGPALVLGGSLLLLRGLVFGGRLPLQYADVLGLWVPTHCMLGHVLSAGHIPTWNPHVMAGVPFAADPQSGWMYLPAMALYAALPCHSALGWFVAFNPCLGGTMLYAFLRNEGLSRPAATVGGTALALPIAGSALAYQLPLAATLAWTAALLASASRLCSARTWPTRLMWIAVTALAWGQLAAAFLSNGVLDGTLILAAYLATRWIRDRRAGLMNAGRAMALLGLLVAATILLNLAYLWPRLHYLSQTSIGLGYARVATLSRTIGPPGSAVEALQPGFPVGWPVRLVLPPGLYLGGAVLALSLVALWSATRRALVVGFASLAAVTYLLSIAPVARLLHFVDSSLVGGAYIHGPGLVGLLLLIALPVLAAVGTDTWWERARGLSGPWLLLALGAALWVILPLAFRTSPAALAFPTLGLAAASALLVASARARVPRGAVPAVIALELLVLPLAAQWGPDLWGKPEVPGLDFQLTRGSAPMQPYFEPGPIARALQAHRGTRYLSWDPIGWDYRGLHVHDQRVDWALMATQRSMIFGLEEAQGYNSVQLLRYWEFVRAENTRALKYNAAFFSKLTPQLLDLLDVGFVVARAGTVPPGALASPVATEGRWSLFRVRVAPPRASVVGDWQVVSAARDQLARVTDPAFDATRTVVLEQDPGIRAAGAPGPSGLATFRWQGDQAARITVRATRPGVLLVRNAYQPGWNATVDGRPVRVIPADFFLQGVPVPPGRHVVDLGYHDPTIGYGLIGSACSLVALAVAVLLVWRRRTASKTDRPSRVTESPADGGQAEREATAAQARIGIAPRRGGGLLGRGRLGPGGRRGREDAR